MLQTYPLYGGADRDFVTIDIREIAAVCDLGQYPAAVGASIVTLKSGRSFRLSVDRNRVHEEWARAIEHGR